VRDLLSRCSLSQLQQQHWLCPNLGVSEENVIAYLFLETGPLGFYVSPLPSLEQQGSFSQFIVGQ
jgi:hypothetical protein